MEESPFPYEVRKICSSDVEEKFREECENYVFVGPKKWCVHKGYVYCKEDLFNFQVRPDDVWIMGFPRSGTTLTQEMVWLIANDLDYKTSMDIPNPSRVVFFEALTIHNDAMVDEDSVIATRIANEKWHKINNMKERRFLKTHLPFSLLPKNLLGNGAKDIYIARNPKDVITSFFNFHDLMRLSGYKFSFKEHCELFMKGLHSCCPHLEHIKEAWNLRHNKNVLFLFYEDILKDKAAVINKIAKFLGKELSEKDIEKLTAHLDINNFKKHKSLNNIQLREHGKTNKNREHDFIRKGIIGDWKNYADPELDKVVTQWIEDGIRGTEISFKYD